MQYGERERRGRENQICRYLEMLLRESRATCSGLRSTSNINWFLDCALRCSRSCLYLSFIVIYVVSDKIVWHSVLGILYLASGIFYCRIALLIASVLFPICRHGISFYISLCFNFDLPSRVVIYLLLLLTRRVKNVNWKWKIISGFIYGKYNGVREISVNKRDRERESDLSSLLLNTPLYCPYKYLFVLFHFVTATSGSARGVEWNLKIDWKPILEINSKNITTASSYV